MKKNPAIIETVKVGIGTAVCTAIMLLCYLALSAFSLKVVIGAVLGYLLAVGNFFFMAVELMNIADSVENQNGGMKMRGNFLFRMLIIGAAMVVGIKSGYCEAIPTILPLLFIRPVITVEQFILKNKSEYNKGDSDEKSDENQEEITQSQEDK